jgi:ADP-ribose pyrophosphatase
MQKYKKIKKISNNRFLNLYEMKAYADTGREFNYYFVSRNDTTKLKLNTKEIQSEGIVIYSVLKEEPEKLVLIKQYRYPIDEYLYELPAGLIDAGESSEQAAVREMKEETGMALEIYARGNPAFRRPFYIAAGFTDECSTAVFGFASGKSSAQFQEETESIQVIFADKTEVKRILAEERVSLRCAYFMMNFLQSDKAEPFQFLE